MVFGELSLTGSVPDKGIKIGSSGVHHCSRRRSGNADLSHKDQTAPQSYRLVKFFVQPSRKRFVTLTCNLIMENFRRESGSGKINVSVPGPLHREKFESLVRETISELYSNARYWDFFRSFNEDSIHDFISEYATRKAWYLINGEKAITGKTNDELRFRGMAENCFWEIQQKKLFNLQAEWRAGLITLDGVETTRDFLCWEYAISLCPFLEPVKQHEVELYLEYLNSPEYKEKNWLYHWQDYDIYKNAGADQELLPAWYRYYDSKMGTGYLMLLPDKIGAEEKKYIKAWKESVSRDELLNHYSENDHSTAPGPNLSVNYGTLDFFIRTFESRNLLRYFQAMELCPDDSAKEAQLQEALRILSRAGEKISLPQAEDWKEAVIMGAMSYKIRMIASNLLRVYEEYLFLTGNGIAPNDNCDKFEYEEQLSFAFAYRDQLRAGRKIING